jgi:hypothetical protein
MGMTGDNGDAATDLTSPTDGERVGDEGVLPIPAGVTLVDDAGQSYTLASTSIDSVLDDSASLALSPIVGSPAEAATLTVSVPVTGEDAAAAPASSGGWWDTPIELSSNPSLGTSPTFLVQEDGEIAVASRVTELPRFTLAANSTGSAAGSLGGTDIGALVVIAPSAGGVSQEGTALTQTVGSSTGPILSEASAATAISPTLTIIGSPTEGTTLTASAVVSGGFTGTTSFHWQRFYAGSWFNIPVQLGPSYTSGEILTFVTSPTYVVREEDENVSAIRVEATFVDGGGVTQATVDSPSIGPVLDAPATLSLSSITGSPVAGSTLTVAGLVTSDDFTGAPVFNWQRFYSGGWWDIPDQPSPYTSGEILTFVTTPSYVVRAEDVDVLAIRVEGTYIDDTGQTFTAFSDVGTEVTTAQPPRLTAGDVRLGEDAASVALAITDAAQDSQYTLGDVTISGVPAGWSLSGDGATSIADGTWTAGAGGLAGLVLVAPSPDEEGSFTLGVTASESATGPSGNLTATGTTSFAVTVNPVAEAPTFGGPTLFIGIEQTGFTLTGLSATGDSDDTLSTTLSGVPSGWTIADPGVTTITGADGGASGTIPAGDLGSLVVFTPDAGGEAATLTLTVTSSEGGSTATGSELLTISATGVGETPSFSPTTLWSGSAGSGITLSGLAASGDSDDTLSPATLTGLTPGWTLVDPVSGATFASSSITGIPVADLGSLVVTAPSSPATATDFLTLTVGSSEGGATATASEVLTVVAAGSGSGTASAAEMLEFGAASAASTSFATGAAGTLKLDQSAASGGVISGFAAGDSIDLTDLAYASNLALSYADNGSGGGTLTVSNGAQVVDLALLGQYAAAGFRAQSDPGGGTLITYSPQTSATDVASLTNPGHQS